MENAFHKASSPEEIFFSQPSFLKELLQESE